MYVFGERNKRNKLRKGRKTRQTRTDKKYVIVAKNLVNNDAKNKIIWEVL